MDFKETQKLLLEGDKPVIIISSSIDGDVHGKVAESLLYLVAKGSPDVKIVINSSGGSVGEGLAIYDLIRAYPGHTIGEVFNQACSIAAIILQACKVRRCARHAGILIHHMNHRRIGHDTLIDEAKLAELLEDSKKTQQLLTDILVRRTGRTEAEVREQCKKDKALIGGEAYAFGLIDEVFDGPDIVVPKPADPGNSAEK